MTNARSVPLNLADQPAGSTWTLISAEGSTGSAAGSAAVGLGEVRRTVLPEGLRVITEHIPTVRSVTVGAWVDVGSRDETPSLAGATHFLEHLVFKGTTRRGPMEISQAVEAAGGDLNAFTTKEYTCYLAQVLDADLGIAVDVVTDLVTSALLRPADVELERPVVLEEIAMHADDPSDAVHELVHEAMWGDARLGRPVIGTVDSVSALSRDQVRRWYRSRYTPPHVVLAVAGNVDHAEVVRLASAAFGRAGMDAESRPGTPRAAGRPPRALGRTLVSERATEQANLVLALPSVGRNDESRYAHSVLSSVLGGGMSSRLFQEVREDRGLAYHVSSFQGRYSETGMFGVQIGTSPEKSGEVIEVVRAVLADAATRGLTEAELSRGKGQMRGSLVIGLEDTGSRMGRLAMAELVHGELPTIDETLRRIDAVTLEEVNEVAATLLTRRPTLAAVGPFSDPEPLLAAVG